MAKHVHTKLAQAVDVRQKVVAAALRAVFAEWARSISKKLSRKFGEKVRPIAKGDLPGHEFRGNQWTGGEGEVWQGGKPSENDKFIENARTAGLTVLTDDRLNRDYVVLGKPTAFYHATSSEHAAVADKVGLKAGDSKGRQVAGVYLSGGTQLSDWRGKGTQTVRVVVPAGTKVYQDLQPNAVFVAHDVPSSWMSTTKKLLKADPATEELVKEILDSLNLDPFGQDVVDEISDELQAIYTRAANAGLAQVKLEPTNEIVNHLDAAAKDYVEQRGAELVGKKVLDDGSVVDNPNAKWSIAQTTREDLQAVLTDGVEQGWSSQQLRDAIESSGAFGEDRALMIARTELAFAHVAGNVEGWKQSGEVTGKRWLLGDLHDVPDECDDAADEGVIAFDDDFSTGDAWPPAHPNCCCLLPGQRVLAPNVTSVMRRSYEGEVFVLCTAAGHELSVTPEHPILTSNGWVAARLLQKGDDLFGGANINGFAFANEDERQQPSLIEDVFGAVGANRPVTIAGCIVPAHFDRNHGVVDCEVYTVRPDAALSANRDGEVCKEPNKVAFVREALVRNCHVLLTLLLSSTVPDFLITATDRLMAFFRVCSSDLMRFLFRSSFAPPFFGLSTLESAESGAITKAPFSVDYPKVTGKLKGAIFRPTGIGDDFSKRLSCRVERDQLVSIRRSFFRGHVYNLQTVEGWYEANGIITHNCDVEPVLSEPEEEAA